MRCPSGGYNSMHGILHYSIQHTALCATDVCQGTVSTIRGLLAMNIIAVDTMDGRKHVRGKFNDHASVERTRDNYSG